MCKETLKMPLMTPSMGNAQTLTGQMSLGPYPIFLDLSFLVAQHIVSARYKKVITNTIVLFYIIFYCSFSLTIYPRHTLLHIHPPNTVVFLQGVCSVTQHQGMLFLSVVFQKKCNA